jgi:hypothetical protein
MCFGPLVLVALTHLVKPTAALPSRRVCVLVCALAVAPTTTILLCLRFQRPVSRQLQRGQLLVDMPHAWLRTMAALLRPSGPLQLCSTVRVYYYRRGRATFQPGDQCKLPGPADARVRPCELHAQDNKEGRKEGRNKEMFFYK